MATSDEILKAARELGKLVSTHPAAARFDAAVARIQADLDAQRLLNDFNRLVQKLGEKEGTGQPIEVAEKRQLEELQGKVIRNVTLRDFQMAQMDYLDLMRKVDEAIQGGPGGAEAGPAGPVIQPGPGLVQ